MNSLSEIAPGLCQCGCGGATKIATMSSTAEKIKKGEYRRFLPGHYAKARAQTEEHGHKWGTGRERIMATTGYVLVRQPGHPHASGTTQYVLEHVLVASAALGKALPKGAVVHHINGIKDDNRPENLVVCQDQAYHFLLHMRQNALEACGHAGWRKCWYCGEWDDPENLWVHPKGKQANHPACKRLYDNARYAARHRRESPTTIEGVR